MTSEDGPVEGNHIRVAVRCRPFNAREKAEGSELALGCSGNSVTIPGLGRGEAKTFSYDHVFSDDATQEQVYKAIGEQIIANAQNAYNGCIFAYGQTGAGKSHSVVGDLSSENDKGILPRACQELFELLNARQENEENFQATVLASYLEIYNEKIFDLLSGGREHGLELQIRLHPQLGAIVVNLTECPMQSFGEAMELFDYGAKLRATCATQMNATSSRSHAVFTIQVRMVGQQSADEGGGMLERQARMHFVDLAGSERAKKTGATGSSLKEGIGINQSLTTLGRVISDLTKAGAKGLPPFRDSKLTLLLRDALMGNSRTELLACVSPSKFNIEETISTLEFASRCKLVKTSAKKNEQSRGDLIAKLTAEKETIQARLLEEKAHSEALCRQLQVELEKAHEKHKAAEQAMEEKKKIEQKLKELEGQYDDIQKAKLSRQFGDAERERLVMENEELHKEKEEARALLKAKEAQEAQPAGTEDSEVLPPVGARVMVSFKKKRLEGIVRHAGPAEFTNGNVVGVELNQAEGMNDGTVKDKRYFDCPAGHGIFIRPSAVEVIPGTGTTTPITSRERSNDLSVRELQERLAELERQEQEQSTETAQEFEFRARLEEQTKAQEARESELLAQMEALKSVQESWTLDQDQIVQKRDELHRQREQELAKLGMNFMDVKLEDIPNAPKLVNLHPDPALKGCLVYYMPIGETVIGSDPHQCRVKLAGISISAKVCTLTNHDNEQLLVRPFGGGLVRVNGGMVGEAGQLLCDGDRLAIGRAYIFQVQLPKKPKDEGMASFNESAFERAMGEISACAEVDPQWENGIQKAMLLVKSDFGIEAANQLLEQAKEASEAIAIANFVLQEMPQRWTDGVTKFELCVMFDAHGLPEVCIVARREDPELEDSKLRRGAVRSAGIWSVEHFENERLPAMHEALMLAKSDEEPSLRHWESRVWSELTIEDYKALVAELMLSEAKRQSVEAQTYGTGGGGGNSGSGSLGWLSGFMSRSFGSSNGRPGMSDKYMGGPEGSLKGNGSCRRGVPPSGILPQRNAVSGMFRSASAGRLERRNHSTSRRTGTSSSPRAVDFRGADFRERVRLEGGHQTAVFAFDGSRDLELTTRTRPIR